MSEKVATAVSTDEARSAFSSIFKSPIIKGSDFLKTNVELISTAELNSLFELVQKLECEIIIKRSGTGLVIILSSLDLY